MARTKVLLYDASGRLVQEAYLYGAVELSWQHGRPERAQIEVPRGSALLSLSNLYPDGQPAYVEVDATESGLDPWLGQLEGLDIGSEGTSRQLVANGPRQWLGDADIASLPARQPVNKSGAAILIDAINDIQTSVDLRVKPLRTEHIGEAIDDRLSGGTVWSLIETLEKERDEEVYLDALSRECMLSLRVLPALGSRDISTAVTLDDSLNCYWSASIDLRGSITELTGIGSSTDVGNRSRGFSAFAPGGRVLGLRRALAAEIAGRTLQPSASAGRSVDATSPTAGANRLRTIAALRRGLAPHYRAQITITDSGLWSDIRTRDIVSTRFYEDDTGAYTEGLAKIRTLQYRVDDMGKKCVASADLWDTVTEL